MNFPHVAVIGCGLIGGSLLKSIRDGYPDAQVSAYDTDAATLDYITKNKLAKTANTAALAAHEADLVILAAPIPALESLAKAIAPALNRNTLVTDVSSAKQAAVNAIAPHVPHFIGGHPIAGKEKGGIEMSDAELFRGRPIILCPNSPQDAHLHELASFWRGLGAGAIEFMPPALHDQVYAVVSHLPQFLAFAIRDLYAGTHYEGDERFTQFMRLTNSSEQMWQPIFAANDAPLQDAVQHYLQLLHQIRSELREAPANLNANAPDPHLVNTVLLPRIVASCLATAVSRFERQLQLPLKRFAGKGFADFAAPAFAAPDEDLATISDHSAEVADALDRFASILNAMR